MNNMENMENMDNPTNFKKLIEITKTLRGPNGCVWDKEQTLESIRPHLIEETYEVIEAIDEKNPAKLKEELGDLLLHVVFFSQISSEKGDFTIEDVIDEICEKLIHRHPHVFGDAKVKDSEEVIDRWEQIKRKEARNKDRKSLLDGIPKHLPALLKALKIQKKAAKTGFDWEKIQDVISKIQEELEEVKDEIKDDHNINRLQEEIGDLLFATVNLARYTSICPEESLNKTIEKFKKRFSYIEENITKRYNKPLDKASLEEMDTLWNEAKKES